jgi:quercetin dioxygenase-like cupin family protein
MFDINKKFKSISQVKPIEMLDGIYRRTLCYNKNIMLCHFYLKKNSKVPIHKHKEHQVGFVIKGKMKFLTKNGEFIAQEGDGYIFQSNEMHGVIILEDSEVIDVFNPLREDYL